MLGCLHVEGTEQVGDKETTMRTFKNSSITMQATVLFVTLVSIYLLGVVAALALDKDRPAHFLPEERKIIYEYYHRGSPSKGLPPGLAKKGKLPPGLQKHLDKNGKLPPGLQKRLEPLPRVMSWAAVTCEPLASPASLA